MRDYEVVALVTGSSEGILQASQRNRFFEGDELELLQPGVKPLKLRVEELRGENGEPINAVPHATMPFSMRCPVPAMPGSLLRRQKK